MNRTQNCRQLLYMMHILCSREEQFACRKGYYITSAKFKATFLDEPYSNLLPVAVYYAHYM